MPFIDDDVIDALYRAKIGIGPSRTPPAERYQHDPVFRGLVDMLRAWLYDNPDVTPTELREATMLAASLHEMEHIRPILITDPVLAEKIRRNLKGEPR